MTENAEQTYSPLAYPPVFEQFWVARASQATGEDREEWALERFEKHVARLSDLFTIDRPESFTDYTAEPDLLNAYGLFFFPQTFSRTRFPLLELLEYRGWAPPSDARILDLGAGLGAAGLSAATLLRDKGAQSISLHAVDHSTKALTVLEEQARQPELSGWLKSETTTADFRDVLNLSAVTRHKYDLIVISFAVNEAFSGGATGLIYNWLKQLSTLLSPQGVILVTEPSVRISAETLQRVRDQIAADDELKIVAPCLHAHSCPLLRDGRFWCHEVRRWRPNWSLEYLNRKLFRDIRDQKYSFLALTSGAWYQQPPADERHFRMIAPMSVQKGHLLTAGCAADGERYEIDLQTRGLKKKQTKQLEKIERGDVVKVARLNELGGENQRRIESREEIESVYHPE